MIGYDGFINARQAKMVANQPVEGGQRTDTGTVDWSKPIEAVHVDGRVTPAERVGVGNAGTHLVEWYASEGSQTRAYYLNGMPLPGHSDWTIRNVQPAIDPALFERMVALVRLVESHHRSLIFGENRQEARDILKALEPVDEDEAIAQQLNNDSAYDLTGLGEEHAARNVRYIQATILEAIKRDRELERERGEAGR